MTDIAARKNEIEYLIRLYLMRMVPCMNVEVTFEDTVGKTSNGNETLMVTGSTITWSRISNRALEARFTFRVPMRTVRHDYSLRALKLMIKHEVAHLVDHHHMSTDLDYTLALNTSGELHKTELFVATANRLGTYSGAVINSRFLEDV